MRINLGIYVTLKQLEIFEFLTAQD